MPAASILPVSFYKNKLYFLFGKENPMEDSSKGFSDFGGGQDGNENYLEAAIRESVEESTGFLGSIEDMTKIIKQYLPLNITYAKRYNHHQITCF